MGWGMRLKSEKDSRAPPHGVTGDRSGDLETQRQRGRSQPGLRG